MPFITCFLCLLVVRLNFTVCLAISYFFLWLVIHRHFQPQTLYDCFPLNLPVLCLDICLKTIWRFSSSFSISCFISVSWVFLSLIWTFSSPFWKLSSSRRDFTSCVWKKKVTPSCDCKWKLLQNKFCYLLFYFIEILIWKQAHFCLLCQEQHYILQKPISI